MTTYHTDSAVVSTQLEGEESVLLSLTTQQYYSLNETGSRIWELLSDGQNAADIIEALTQEWDVGHDEAAKTVESFLRELTEEGLVEAVEDDGE